jgi:eukaryotic-like serine/threonine-protein kinase
MPAGLSVADLLSRYLEAKRQNPAITPEQFTQDPQELQQLQSALADLSGSMQGTIEHQEGATPLQTLQSLPAKPEAPMPTKLGIYTIIKKVGEGAMGSVYLGKDPRLNREVAIKVMKPELASSDVARARFLREAQSMAAVTHDNIATIYAADEEANGTTWLAMEFLKGTTLDEYVKKGRPLKYGHIIRFGRDIARGLQAAHSKGLIHRDIKPANIWLEVPNGRVKLLDFGLARQVDETNEVTGSNTVVGTPSYMAPEQANNDPNLDHRCDLFSLGVVLYRLTTGDLPFKGTTLVSTLMALATKDPTPVLSIKPDCPTGLAELIHQLLQKQPEDRPKSAKAVAETLFNLEKSLSQSGQQPIVEALPPIVEPSLTALTPWAGIDESATNQPNQTKADSIQTVAVAATGLDSPPKRRKAILASVCGLALLLFGFIVIKITNKDGSVTEIKVPEDSKIEIGFDPKVTGKELTKKTESIPATFKNSIGMEFVKVPKGTGWLGGGAGNQGETKVVIEQDFYLGKYEVTQEEWEAVTGLNPSHFSRNGAGKDAVKDIPDADLKRFPVEMVSWDDCQLFIKRLNEKEKDTGWVYRLPKEVEWEYACRGGPVDKLDSAFDFYFAKPTNSLKLEQANFAPAEGKGLQRTCKVGSYEPNLLGLYDMHSNVWEWCEDSKKSKDGVPNQGRGRQGGSWCDISWSCRATGRDSILPSEHYYGGGLRLARVAVGPAVVVPAMTDRDVVAAFLKSGKGFFGGHTSNDYVELKKGSQLPDGPFEIREASFDSENENLQDEELVLLHNCRNLVGLKIINQKKITDNGLLALGRLPSLKTLLLDGTPVSDMGLKSLDGFPNLLVFNSFGANVSETGLTYLKNCPKLENVGVSPIPEKTLLMLREHCKDLNQIFWIGGDGTPFSLAPLLDLPKLEHIGCYGYLMTGENLASLAKHPSLVHLAVQAPIPERMAKLALLGGRIRKLDIRDQTGRGLFVKSESWTVVTHIKGLVELTVSNEIGVDGKALKLIAGMPELKRLTVTDDSDRKIYRTYTAEDISAFRKARPDVTLSIDGKTYEDAADPDRNAGPLTPTFKNSLGMEFVRVPKGTGWLGGGAGKQGETKVVIEQDFYLGKFEVTQEEWEAVTGQNPSHFSRNGGGKDAVKDIPDADLKRFPVESVSWDDCQLFIKKLNEKEKDTGWVYRLPKEAEWEYACRGGPVDKLDSAFDFYFAKPTNTLLPGQVNFNYVLNKRTCKVGSYEPNLLALNDMHGNVWEWCEDVATGADGASLRVNRGGHWGGDSRDCRAVARRTDPPFAWALNLGLRLARVPVGPAVAVPAATDPNRKAAEWLLNRDAEFGYSDATGFHLVTKGMKHELPKGEVMLNNFNLSKAEFADQDLAKFRGLKQLSSVVLVASEITNVGCEHLATLPTLQKLYLTDTKISDVGLKHLAQAAKLEVLHISGTKITDEGLQQLVALKSLTELTVVKTGVSEAGVKKLSVALPKCKIESDFGTYGPK